MSEDFDREEDLHFFAQLYLFEPEYTDDELREMDHSHTTTGTSFWKTESTAVDFSFRHIFPWPGLKSSGEKSSLHNLIWLMFPSGKSTSRWTDSSHSWSRSGSFTGKVWKVSLSSVCVGNARLLSLTGFQWFGHPRNAHFCTILKTTPRPKPEFNSCIQHASSSDSKQSAAHRVIRIHGALVNVPPKQMRKRRKCWKKKISPKKYSRCFITFQLNHWCHIDFDDVFGTFLGLERVRTLAVYGRIRKLSD